MLSTDVFDSPGTSIQPCWLAKEVEYLSDSSRLVNIGCAAQDPMPIFVLAMDPEWINLHVLF